MRLGWHKVLALSESSLNHLKIFSRHKHAISVISSGSKCVFLWRKSNDILLQVKRSNTKREKKKGYQHLKGRCWKAYFREQGAGHSDYAYPTEEFEGSDDSDYLLQETAFGEERANYWEIVAGTFLSLLFLLVDQISLPANKVCEILLEKCLMSSGFPDTLKNSSIYTILKI